MSVNPSLSWDLVFDVRQLLAFPFMVHALLAGTVVAVLGAVVGWYMVLRRQAFAGHTLSVMAFPGASGAALAGLPTALGFYLACTAGALAIGIGAPSTSADRRTESAAIGTVQAVGLALGFLFLALDAQLLGGPETLLFGTFLGITQGQVLVLAAITAGCLAALALAARPLLFCTLDRESARAAGVPVRALDLGFLLVLGLAVAATSQITGALLVFALLVAPAATAQLVTPRPLAGLALSVALGLSTVWVALGLAYFSPYPVGFYVTSLGFGVYVLVRLARGAAARVR